MKKEDQDTTLLDFDISSNKDFKKDSFKTTNINILLNRVRLNKKKSFKKKLILSLILTFILSAALYFLIK